MVVSHEGNLVCPVCRVRVENDEIIYFLGDIYHPEHFKCSACERLIRLGEDAIDLNGVPLCSNCFWKKPVPKCCVCNEVFQDWVYEIDERFYHQACMRCCKCGVNVKYSRCFYYKKNMYCHEHYWKLKTCCTWLRLWYSLFD